MGRGGRRWLAVSGGVLINGLILAGLVLVEEPAPIVEEQPVIVLDLERPERQRPRSRPENASTALASRPAAPESVTTPSAGLEGTVVAPTGSPAVSPEIEPAWTVDPKAVERWRLTEGDPNAGWGRFYRACKGLSDEHMTPDEKERCYGGWNDRKDKRPSPAFIGPIDERKWQAFERPPPPPPDKEFQRHERCKVYRRSRVGADASSMPSLREGGCL